ncbi:MAG TPA: TonB family protein [Steroidobacteraceae bacterium]|nr:TonB family protein [Steroidobacteraceae bacterium]
MASAGSRSSRNPAAAPPAASAGAPPSVQPSVDVTAITTRDEFLLELGQALAGQASIRPVDSVEAALESLGGRSRRGQVLVLDAHQVNEVRPTVEAVQAGAPQAVILVFAPPPLERQVASSVKGSAVFAVLPSSPVDARKTLAVFAGVIEEAAARRTPAAPAPAALSPATPAVPADLEVESTRSAAALKVPGMSGGKGRTLVLIAVVALGALAAAGWYFTRDKGAVPAASAAHATAPAATPAEPTAAEPAEAALPPAPTPELSIVHGKVDELLEKARLAMKERRYTEPAGDNALLYYRSAVAANASDGEARDGLGRVAGVIASRFDEALSASRLDEAAQDFANFRAAVPDDPRVADLGARLANAQLAKALADGNPDRAAALLRQAQQSGVLSGEQLAKWRGEIARRQDEAKVQRLAGLVADRIRDGKLVDPADDSARSYLRQLLSAAPANAATQRAAHDLSAAYLRKAREAAVARNNAEADRWLNEARAAGMSAADIGAFQRDLAGAQAKATRAEGDRFAQLARERVRDGRLTDPAQDSAAYYLTQLQAADPDNAALLSVSRDLAKLLLERARAALQSGRSADQDLAAARRFGADPKDIQAAQQSAAAPRSGSAVDPATLAASLKAVKTVPPEYPQSALSKGLAGSVLLSFTVDAKGNTRDVQVLQSTPAGVFDRAAVSAVKRWRYAPVIVDGNAVEVPTRTLVRFELPKQ